MKKILLVTVLIGLFVSCGTEKGLNVSEIDAVRSTLTGTWCNQFDGKENLTIEFDENFVSDVCKVIGTYTIEADSTFVATVTASNGGATCMPIGTHTCTYSLTNNDDTLELKCVIQANNYVTTFNRGRCQ